MNQFRMKFIRTVEELLDAWPFLLEGFQKLKELTEVQRGMSEESFFRLLLKILSGQEDEGCIVIGESHKGNRAGFTVAFDNTDEYRLTGKALLVYAIFWKGTYGLNSKEGFRVLERWAKERGYSELHICSSRITGAAMRLFEKRWGFRRDLISFRKSI